MLVRPLEVQVRRPPLLWFQHRRITHAGLEPHIQNVAFLLEFRPATLFALGPGGSNAAAWFANQ